MKFAGAELGVNYETVTFKKGGKDVTLKVSALPFGWREKIEATGAIDVPAPPKYILRKPDGRPEKGTDGIVLQGRNEDDPEYVKARNASDSRRLALRLAEHLRDEPAVEFEAKPPVTKDKDAWVAYADAIYAEVTSSGLTESEIGLILQAGNMASLDVDVEKVSEDFLSDLPEDSLESESQS